MKNPFLFKPLTYEKIIEEFQKGNDYWIDSNDNKKKLIVDTIFQYEHRLLFGDIENTTTLEFYQDYNLDLEGYYNGNLDLLGINIEREDCLKLYGTIRHELWHKYQKVEIENEIEKYGSLKEGSRLYLIDFYRNETDKEFQFLNFKDKGNFHINLIDNSYTIIKEISNIMYYFNICERESFFYEEHFKINDIDYFKKGIEYFNKRYNLNLNREEIFEIVDNSFYLLSINSYPETDLEASVMYDISCLALLNNNKISELECLNMLKDSYKKVQLAQFGYCLDKNDKYGDKIITNSLMPVAKDYYDSFDSYSQLSDFQKRDNPYITAIFILKHKQKSKEYLKEYLNEESVDYLFAYLKVEKERFNEELFELLRDMYEDKYEKYVEEMEYD